MHETSTPVTQPKPAQRQHGTRAARRAWALDRRTNESKRLIAAMEDLARQTGVPFDLGDGLLRRAAELAVCAAQGRIDLLRRAPGIDIDLCLRMEGLASRAARELHSRARAKTNTGPTLAEYLAAKAAAESGAAE
jgi:hypothetical protein